MNRTIKVALLAVLGTALFVPAIAQDNFPDVPENHWAYEALENLKREGILVGYPDGTYKGPRDLTRYELAVALNAAYQRMKMMHDGLADQIAEIKRSLSGAGGGPDVKPILDRLTAVENQLKGMSRLQSDVDSMKRMADEFQKELASMGVDVEAMKKDIADLQARMKSGGSTGTVTISGDANLVVHTGEGDGEVSAMGIDGRQLGLNDAGTQAVGSSRDFNVFHELALNLSGGGDGAPKWWGTIVYGNMVGVAGTTATSGYGNQSNRFGGQPFREGNGDTYIQSFGVELENGVAGMPFKAVIGRVGLQTANPYLYKRLDVTPYWKNDRWDNGDWTMDGAIISFGFGGDSNFRLFGGRNSNRRTNGGTELQPMMGTGTSSVEGTYGADVNFKLGAVGDINLAYLLHSDNNNSFGAAPDRLEVYGGSANLNLVKGLPIAVGYGKSTLKDKGTAINDNDNESMWAKVAWEGDKWGFGGGYRRVESNYITAGSWSRIGTNWSPTNIETFNGKAWFGMGENAKLWAGGEFGETIDTLGGIPAESKITSANVGLEWGFNEWWKAMLGYEDVKVDFAGSATEIRQKWFTVGFGWMMGKNSSLNLTYQYGDVKNGAAWGAGPAGNYKGHIVATSLGIKF